MKKLILLQFIFVLCFWTCSSDDDEDAVICTEEFRIVGLTITGETLTDFYTIRNTLNDTLRFQEQSFNDFYPVLSDNYQKELENKQESFTFVGLKNDSVLVRENYVIEADKCHVNKVSGATEIKL